MRRMTFLGKLPDRAIIRISGGDRRSFLQGLITQDIERLTPGGAIFSALLTPQGKILFDFFVVDHGEEYFLDCPRDNANDLLKRMTLYKLRAKVNMEIDDALSVAVSENEVAENDAVRFRDPRLDALGWRTIVKKDLEPAADYDARRIALGVPEFGKDFGADEVFLLDVNYDALNAVSYKKGCFVGQEVTSRMKRKGDIRKRTLIADVDAAAPTKGDVITAGASKLGDIMSAGNGKALALIRRDRWENAKKAGEAPNIEGRKLRLHIPDYLERG